MSTMKGKVAVVTGGTSGIGLAVVSALVQDGARVFVLARSAGASPLPEGPGEAIPVACDFSDPEAVRRAARQVADACGAVHLLVNNAGVFLPERAENAEGVEMTFQVNYLSHFVLTSLLAERLVAGEARVVSVIAPVNGVKLDFDDLMSKKRYSFLDASARSKLALVMLNEKLARDLGARGVRAVSYYPGLVRSPLYGSTPLPLRALVKLFGQSPAQAARNLLAAAFADAPAGSHRFVEKKSEGALRGMAADATAVERLWETSRTLAHLS